MWQLKGIRRNRKGKMLFASKWRECPSYVSGLVGNYKLTVNFLNEKQLNMNKQEDYRKIIRRIIRDQIRNFGR